MVSLPVVFSCFLVFLFLFYFILMTLISAIRLSETLWLHLPLSHVIVIGACWGLLADEALALRFITVSPGLSDTVCGTESRFMTCLLNNNISEEPGCHASLAMKASGSFQPGRHFRPWLPSLALFTPGPVLLFHSTSKLVVRSAQSVVTDCKLRKGN